jgi:predicted small lipoprotein YifL
MKKLIYSLFALAMTAMTFTGCEDVPSPYDLPSDSDTTHVTPIAPTGTGTKDDPFNVAGALNYIASR